MSRVTTDLNVGSALTVWVATFHGWPHDDTKVVIWKALKQDVSAICWADTECRNKIHEIADGNVMTEFAGGALWDLTL